ncbi:chemotaxis protein CheW [Leptolyngbya sp. FACHB-261]|uniref:hybrid sensor histidine kinase/response regulator n=1 Tax=Leptolyngbya sp. FACHB-261 TaxID=2692806 RepID=UPI001683B3E3|nr:chemotaxis protein CheW [Leptolyngbya sp. FACHB-261]MBD2104026.1 chemotaxis protein CheW [Leptolyngbya sp. FACHB-261]
MNQEDYRQLIGAFMSETQEFLQSLERNLLNLEKATDSAARSKTIENLFRAAHSIKGSALMFGFEDLSRCAHSLEDCFAVLRDQADLTQPVPDIVINLLLSGLDQLQAAVSFARRGNTQDPTRVGTLAKILVELEAEFRAQVPTQALDQPSNQLPLVLPKETTASAAIQAVFANEVSEILQQLGTQIQRGVKQGSYEGLISEARKLTGLAGMLQMPGFQKIAQLLETLGDLSPTVVDPELLVAVYPQVLRELQAGQDAILSGRADAAGPSPELQTAVLQLQQQALNADLNAEFNWDSFSTEADLADLDEVSPLEPLWDSEPLDTDQFAALLDAASDSELSELGELSETEVEIQSLGQGRQTKRVDADEIPLHLIFPTLTEVVETPVSEVTLVDASLSGTTREETTISERISETTIAEPSLSEATVAELEPERLKDSPPACEEPSGPAPDSFIRVEASRLTELLNLVGELVINRTNLESQVAQLRTTVKQLRGGTAELQRAGAELREDYDRLTVPQRQQPASRPSQAAAANSNGKLSAGFDPLELDQYGEFHIRAQGVIETTQDIDFASDRTNQIVFDVERGLDQLRRITNRLRSRVLQLRVLPFSHIVDPLPRAIRTLCRTYGKEVNLLLLGRELELDESILEELRDPLIHLVRNAFDHGIEPPSERRQFGKPVSGEIEIAARRQGSHTLISVRDDGRGIDLEKVRAHAVERRLVSVGKALDLSPADLYSLLFTPEFSTTDQVTALSGRGMGLDIVRTTVQRLRGSIAIDSTPGQGTLFTLKLPLVLSILQALLVQVGQQTLAVPMDVIEEMLHIEPERIHTAGQHQMFRWRGEFLRLIRLSDLLSYSQPTAELPNTLADSTHLSLLIVNISNGYLAVLVDRLLSQKEIVIKPLPAPLSKTKGIAGSTIVGDGSVVLIVDVSDLAAAAPVLNQLSEPVLPYSAQAQRVRPALPSQATAAKATQFLPVPERPAVTVMVVDDAYAVRRLVANCLMRRQYQVLQAKDGQDALEQLQAGAKCHFILADIEMPRMNGFQLLQALRANSELQSIPVAMLTSRTGQKHRQMALELGANAHFIKPYKESELLDTIARLTQQSRLSPSI